MPLRFAKDFRSFADLAEAFTRDQDYRIVRLPRPGSSTMVLAPHGGSIEGFNTSLVYYPDSRVTVVSLGNVNGNAPDRMTDQLGRLVHGKEAGIVGHLRGLWPALVGRLSSK